MDFNKEILIIDTVTEVDRICIFIKDQVSMMKRDGAVIGLSGGIDSSLCATLCIKALGRENVLGLILPERESSPISSEYALMLASEIGLKTITVDVTKTLEGFGTYDKRDEVIRELFPEYDSEHKSKIVLPPDLLSKDAFNFFTLKIVDKAGHVKSARLNNDRLRRIVAASNTKERTRMMQLYFHAEANNYIVCGTTNRDELIQGFFVKYGDGGVDIEPIAHLYKMQVYQLARHLGVLEDIIKRAPSPDTFSLEVTDEEIHFRIPFDKLDLLLYAWEKDVSALRVSEVMGLTEDQVKRVFRDISSKYKTTKYVRLPPSSLK
jgi:NAD+ synthase